MSGGGACLSLGLVAPRGTTVGSIDCRHLERRGSVVRSPRVPLAARLASVALPSRLLARVGLSGEGKKFSKAHLFGDERVKLFYFAAIIVEQKEEGGLRSRRSFHAQIAEIFQSPFELFQIVQKILRPQASASANRCWL